MKSRFLNVGDDVHDQRVRERPNCKRGSENFSTTFDFGIPKPCMVAHSQLCHLSSSERAD